MMINETMKNLMDKVSVLEEFEKKADAYANKQTDDFLAGRQPDYSQNDAMTHQVTTIITEIAYAARLCVEEWKVAQSETSKK